MIDEELQNRMENGETAESRDAVAYKRVFDALKKEPGYSLSPDFANRVIARWSPTQQKTSGEMFWFYAGIAGCVVAMFVAVAVTNFKFTLGVFQFISGYPGLITFAIAFVLALQWIDRKFVRTA